MPGGSLILIEKIKSKIPDLNKTFMDFHHQFKEKNGYSKLEISQKREALENVLTPWTIEQNNQLIQSSGFSKVELFFIWNNLFRDKFQIGIIFYIERYHMCRII